MATAKQQVGDWGERYVARTCVCPSCKQRGTTQLLPRNFKCADLICDFCGYLAQVKTKQVADVDVIPDQLLGGAWEPQRARMQAGIYFPLYVVLVTRDRAGSATYFLSADLQIPEMFKPRDPLSPNAKRAGWQGFRIDCSLVRDRFVRLA